jgi:TolA-binding protein
MSVLSMHPEELFDKLAQGTLTTAEGDRLRAHLASCNVCRFELAVRGDFSAEQLGPEPCVSPSPSPEAAALPRHAGTASTRSRRARRVAFVWFGAAALLLMATGALASVLTGRAPWRLFEPTKSDSPASPPPPARKTRESRAASRTAEKPPSAPTAPPMTGEPATSGASSAPAAPPAAPAQTADTRAASVARTSGREAAPALATNATALFADANNARVRGDHTRAVKLYRQLQREFPQSPEAVLSQLTLSTLLLHAGDARGALAGFNVYLSRSSRPLEAEALVGRALALRSLGQTVAEVAAWQVVLKRYPGSSYARRASDRLAALGRL